MGLLIFDLAKKIGKSPANAKGVSLRSMSGGNAPNMVADHARAVIKADSYDAIKDKIAEFRKSTGYQINAKGIGKNLEITTQGISAHGARPGKGLNAISILMKFFEEIGLENEDVRDFIDFYNKHIGFNLSGELIGCGFEDEPSGKLIFNVGVVNIDDESASVTVNIRYPVTMNDEQVYTSILPVVNQYNLGIIKKEHKAPIYIEKDDPMIRTLMDVYKKHTGDMDSEPIVIGGGTYARAVKNTVAFGADFPGEPELAHQKNEYMGVDKLVKCAKIFADAIFELADGKVVPREEA
jgi:succinyl-diaminopimelate desuccinylase